MGINVRVQDAPKQSGIIAAQVKLEKDLRSCMRCEFFYGNNSQCLAKKCIKEESKPEITEEDKESMCFGYNPVSVCSQAVAKCQAGGMITTTDNLANLLSEGKITQKEYDSYYPYDGLGYYSVFVETDLNKASTTSGRKLGSEDGIADYIAEMMMLETEPVFYIEYTGVYSLNGTEFYEFRCYR